MQLHNDEGRKELGFKSVSTSYVISGGGGGGHSGTEGGRTFVTYFAEEGVFF